MYIKLFFVIIFIILCDFAFTDFSLLEIIIMDIIAFIVISFKIIAESEDDSTSYTNVSNINNAAGTKSDLLKELNRNKAEEKTRKFVLEELEKGNPEPYKMEYNELEDDMFQDYDEE